MLFQSDYELYHVIGSNIKYFWEKAGLTQMQLADELKISISYLSKLEASSANKSLSISVLNHIANTLNININEFFVKR